MYPAKRKECSEEDNGSMRKAIMGFDILDAPQKKNSSLAATADNSEVKGAKELLRQMCATQKVENYI